MTKQPTCEEAPQLADAEVAEALLARGGILSSAASYLADKLGRRVTRLEIENRVAASPALAEAREIAEQRRFEQALKGGRFGWRGDTAFDAIVQIHENAMRAAREDDE